MYYMMQQIVYNDNEFELDSIGLHFGQGITL